VSATQSISYTNCTCRPGTMGNITGPLQASCVPCPVNRFCPSTPPLSVCGCQ
jgi:hypothetical protein